MLLEDGIKALQQQQFSEAVELLEDYCKDPTHQNTPTYIQAQMALARAYRGNNQREQAFTLGQALKSHKDPQVSEWAKGFISILVAEEKKTHGTVSTKILTTPQKPLRTPEHEVRFPRQKAIFHLRLAFYLTNLAIFTIIFACCFTLINLITQNNINGFIFAFLITIIIGLMSFFSSTLVIDFIQKRLYKTQWLTLSKIRKFSPETANLITKVCRKKQINPPRLGIINDPNPIIFSYGVLPNEARIVITQGLLDYLKDEEIAAVYAHELGHIFQWDFTLMTMGTSLIQTSYLLYYLIEKLSHKNTKINRLFALIRATSIFPYLVYLFINYLMCHLSRTREYFADEFAMNITGNPNGLARALVKIAYGLLEKQKESKPSTLIALTRILTIYDAKAALIPGTAYFLTSDFHQVGQTFLWDLCNPWRIWVELNSSHPLIGRRIHTLMKYAQLLELENQFDTIAVIVQGNQLNKRKLFLNFILEILIFNSQWIGTFGGLMIGFFLNSQVGTGIGIISFAVLGFGGGLLLKTLTIYSKCINVPHTDIYSLICNPYASPLRGSPIQLQGKLIGQKYPIYELGSNIMLQDSSGLISVRFSSPFGALGNFFLSWAKYKNLIDSDVNLIGWFRRGMSPWIDWYYIANPTLSVSNYPRFWLLLRGGGIIVVGLVMLIYAIGTHRLTVN